MRRNAGIVLLLLSLAASAQAGQPEGCCDPHCIVPPPRRCPNCDTDPCAHRLSLCCFCSCGHTQALLAEASARDVCQRLSAVQKLGCRLHADACREPAVLDALLRALQCDSCWHVRRAAAWGLFHQRVPTEAVVLALYLSSRLDPHYLVRIRAAEALDLLTLGKAECYEEMYQAADQLIRVLRAKGYEPGRDCCLITAATACGPKGSLSISTTLPEDPPKPAETLPKPRKLPVEKLPEGE